MSSYGKVAYDAYCESAGGVSLVTGDKLPKHVDLPVAIRQAWDDAADAVLALYRDDDDDGDRDDYDDDDDYGDWDDYLDYDDVAGPFD